MRIVGCAIGLWIGMAVPCEAYQERAWRELSDRTLSRMGRALLRGQTRHWTHAESPHFIYHAAVPDPLPGLAREAEWVVAELARRVPADVDAPGRIYVLTDRRAWQRLMQVSGRRPEGIALQIKNEIFLLRDPDQPPAYVDLPHELVHWWLWGLYEGTLPLWIEEGLAEYWGWQLAQTYHRQRQRHLYRDRPIISPTLWLPWDELLARTTYPAEVEANRAFYRQSEALMATLLERVGQAELPNWIRHMQAADWQLEQVMHDSYGWNEADMIRLWQQVEKRLK